MKLYGMLNLYDINITNKKVQTVFSQQASLNTNVKVYVTPLLSYTHLLYNV